MSDNAARSALNRMNLREQFIAYHYEGVAGDLAEMARTNPEAAREKFLSEGRHELCEAYGYSRRDQSKPFAFADGVAIIPVHGTLINRFGGYYGYVTGYNFIRSQFNAALIDDDVKAIVFDHNSYGGEAAGCFELAGEIAAGRGKKPMLAMVDSNCYSASYALASAADKIAVIPSAGVGSIGVVAMHVDMSKMLDNFGVKITFIHSGAHKVDGNPYEALSAETKADIQAGVDKSRAKFVSVVAGNLGMDDKIVHNTEARTYRADDALKIGLVHAIGTPNDALQSLLTGDDSDPSEEGATTQPKQEQQMADETTKETATVDQAAVRKAERERMSGIINCEEAKGKSKLANHLAMNTEMSVADAKSMLAVAAAEVVEPAAAAAVVEPPKAAASTTSPLEKAMAETGGGPKVGADNAAATEQASTVDSILSSFGAATGEKFEKAA